MANGADDKAKSASEPVPGQEATSPAAVDSGDAGDVAPRPRCVSIDQYYLYKIGLFRDGAEIKIEDFGMYAVPASLSAEEGRFLLVLSPKEQKHFEKFILAPSRLFLRKRFQHNPNADPLLIRINTRIVSIEPLSQNENLCIFTMAFKTPPAAWKELFAGLVMDEDFLLERYQKSVNDAWPRAPVAKLSLPKLDPHAIVRMPDGETKKAKIVSLSPNSGEFFVDACEGDFVAGMEKAFRFVHERYNFYVRGRVESVRASAEVPGFYFVTCALPFHPALVELVASASNSKAFSL